MNTFEKAKKLTSMTLEIYGHVADNAFFGEVTDWTFVVRHCGKKVFGLCDFVNQEIILDPRVMEYGTWEEIKGVILHECAHALAGIERSNKNIMAHGKLWRKWANRLGCNPRAKANLSPALMEHYHIKTEPKYRIISIINDKVTVHGAAGRKMKNLSQRYYPNVENSLGNLYLIESVLFKKLDTIESIKRHAFQ